MIYKIWKDPVWSKVIAIGIIGLIVDYYLNLWIIIKNKFTSFLTYITNYSEVQNWIIGLMSICTLLVILFIIFGIWNLFFKKNQKSNWENYKQDNFFGLEWHWEYNQFDKQPNNIYSLCPNCKYQLYPTDNYHNLSYHCDNCQTSFQSINSNYQQLQHKITLNIQQKLRTGTYTKHSQS